MTSPAEPAMPHEPPQDAAQVFTVRLWRHGSRWRLAVRPAGAGRTVLLQSPDELVAYFSGALDATADTTTPPDRD